MKIEHDGRSYDFDMDSLEAAELRVVEQHSGMTLPEWMDGLKRGKVDSLVAIVFVAKRRAGDTVEWSDLDGLVVVDLMRMFAEANGIDVDALERGEEPALPEALNRAARRAKPATAPSKRPAARRAAVK